METAKLNQEYLGPLMWGHSFVLSHLTESGFVKTNLPISSHNVPTIRDTRHIDTWAKLYICSFHAELKLFFFERHEKQNFFVANQRNGLSKNWY